MVTVKVEKSILEWPTDGVYRVKKRPPGYQPCSNPDWKYVDSTTENFWSGQVDKTLSCNDLDYNFFFVYIRREFEDGNVLSDTSGDIFVNASFNDSLPNAKNVLILKAYYTRDPGVGGGNNGMFIDAYDMEVGDFIADDFVVASVNGKPDKALTKAANNGYIDTDAQISLGMPVSVTVTTVNVSPIFEYNAIRFDHWEQQWVFTGGHQISVPTNPTLVVYQSDLIYGVAFLHLSKVKPRRLGEIDAYDPFWWLKHGELLSTKYNPSDPYVKRFLDVVSVIQRVAALHPEKRMGAINNIHARMNGLHEEIARLEE